MHKVIHELTVTDNEIQELQQDIIKTKQHLTRLQVVLSNKQAKKQDLEQRLEKIKRKRQSSDN